MHFKFQDAIQTKFDPNCSKIAKTVFLLYESCEPVYAKTLLDPVGYLKWLILVCIVIIIFISCNFRYAGSHVPKFRNIIL